MRASPRIDPIEEREKGREREIIQKNQSEVIEAVFRVVEKIPQRWQLEKNCKWTATSRQERCLSVWLKMQRAHKNPPGWRVDTLRRKSEMPKHGYRTPKKPTR
jgi:hypothetical protein